MKSSGAAIVVQIFVLTLELAALLWGTFGIYQAAFPGPCGDNPGPGLGVIESWVLCFPVGLVGLLVGWLLKKGSLELRRLCIYASLIALVLPVIATIFLERWHCS